MEDEVQDFLISKITCVNSGLKILNYYALEGAENAEPEFLEMLQEGMTRDLQEIFKIIFSEIKE